MMIMDFLVCHETLHRLIDWAWFYVCTNTI